MKLCITTWVLLLAFAATPSSADISYRVRPSHGELESFGKTSRQFDCPMETRTKLWRALSKQPVITRRESGAIDITFNFEGEKRQVATHQHKGLEGKLIGYWDSKIPGLSFYVGITERRGKPPLVEVGIDLVSMTAHPDGSTRESVCSEKWTGIGDKF